MAQVLTQYQWEPAALLVDPNVEDPTDHQHGSHHQFMLTVTDEVGCDNTDEVVVTVIGGPLGVTATASPQTLCIGNSLRLHGDPDRRQRKLYLQLDLFAARVHIKPPGH